MIRLTPPLSLKTQRVLVELALFGVQRHEHADRVEDRRQRQPVREGDVDEERRDQREEAPAVLLAGDAGDEVVGCASMIASKKL